MLVKWPILLPDLMGDYTASLSRHDEVEFFFSGSMPMYPNVQTGAIFPLWECPQRLCIKSCHLWYVSLMPWVGHSVSVNQPFYFISCWNERSRLHWVSLDHWLSSKEYHYKCSFLQGSKNAYYKHWCFIANSWQPLSSTLRVGQRSN